MFSSMTSAMIEGMIRGCHRGNGRIRDENEDSVMTSKLREDCTILRVSSGKSNTGRNIVG